jgi:lysophospholipase L1-like esterase
MVQLRDVGPALTLTQWVSHPFLPFVGRPNSVYTTDLASWGIRIRVENNSYGFRTHEFPARKGAKDFVVVCLGESTTWGAAAETNAASWPELLEALLAERYPERDVRVYNLAAPTGTTAYSVVALALVGIHLDPDLVIVYHGFNEYGAMVAENFRTDHSHHFRNFDPQTAWRGIRRNLPPLLQRSYALMVASDLADSAMGVNMMSYYLVRENPEDVRASQPGVDATLRNFDAIRAMAASKNGEALFATFQVYHQSSYELMNRILRDHFVGSGAWFVDQEALIPDEDRSLQLDECHFTRKGDELMARNFFDAIVARGLVRPPAGG